MTNLEMAMRSEKRVSDYSEEQVKEALSEMQFFARRYDELDEVRYASRRESFDIAILAIRDALRGDFEV